MDKKQDKVLIYNDMKTNRHFVRYSVTSIDGMSVRNDWNFIYLPELFDKSFIVKEIYSIDDSIDIDEIIDVLQLNTV